MKHGRHDGAQCFWIGLTKRSQNEFMLPIFSLRMPSASKNCIIFKAGPSSERSPTITRVLGYNVA